MHILTQRHLHRRTMLRGLGATFALPMLDAMVPARATTVQPPQRLAFFYIPNGVIQNAWHPQETGPSFELPPSLQPLQAHKKHLNIFTGLDRRFRGGTGVHAQAACAWLTSSPPTEALQGSFPTNITVDQIAARHIGANSLLPSLELSCNSHTNARETKHFETISWRGPGFALTPEKNPREVYRRLFGKPNPQDKALLDAILEDTHRLRATLGKADQQQLDEYLDSVRSIETRVQRAEAAAAQRVQPEMAQPEGIPEHRGEYIRLMGDLTVLGFQQDITRISTLLIDPERWDTPRMFHGVFDTPLNHHVLTHTKGDEAIAKLKAIDHFHVQQFSYVIDRMKTTVDANGSLLENSCLILGSGMGDGRIHDYSNLPVVTAGNLRGALKTGQHWKFEGQKPLADLWLTILQAVGINRQTFADSTGPISELFA